MFNITCNSDVIYNLLQFQTYCISRFTDVEDKNKENDQINQNYSVFEAITSSMMNKSNKKCKLNLERY